jgi:predicted solute-binding protein
MKQRLAQLKMSQLVVEDEQTLKSVFKKHLRSLNIDDSLVDEYLKMVIFTVGNITVGGTSPFVETITVKPTEKVMLLPAVKGG